MNKVDFTYNDDKYFVQCNNDDKMKDIIDKFLNKAGKNRRNIVFLYEGEFVNDKFEGNGKYIWKDGKYYIGEFKKGLIHGEGTLYYQNNNIQYEGEFLNNKYEGDGKYIWENGRYYIGEFKNGLISGKGIEYYENGMIKYEGDFINGKFLMKKAKAKELQAEKKQVQIIIQKISKSRRASCTDDIYGVRRCYKIYRMVVSKNENWGNAREMRNLLDATIQKLSERVSQLPPDQVTKETYQLILPEDID